MSVLYPSALVRTQEQNRKENENMVYWSQTCRKYRQYHFRPCLAVRKHDSSKYTWCTVLGVVTNLTAQNCSYLGVLYLLVGRQSTPASKIIEGSYLRLDTFLWGVYFRFLCNISNSCGEVLLSCLLTVIPLSASFSVSLSINAIVNMITVRENINPHFQC